MAEVFTIISNVREGKLARNRKRISEAIEAFEGKNVEVTIRRARKQRSNQQNRYLWGCVYPILQAGFKDIGYRLSLDEVHGFVKDYFLNLGSSVIIDEIVIPETGQVLKRVKSTSELTPTEFNEYKLEIQEWASQTLGIQIPDPNEQIAFTS